MNFAILKNFVDKQKVSSMADYLDHLNFLNQLVINTENGSCDRYRCFEKELVGLIPRLEEVFQKQLFPTYSLARIYMPGATLTPHIDREACEYSITLCLDNENTPWPIFVKENDHVHEVILYPGDALAYKGIEQPHWRERLKTGTTYQAFFHYVDQKGPYACYMYDRLRNTYIPGVMATHRPPKP